MAKAHPLSATWHQCAAFSTLRFSNGCQQLPFHFGVTAEWVPGLLWKEKHGHFHPGHGTLIGYYHTKRCAGCQRGRGSMSFPKIRFWSNSWRACHTRGGLNCKFVFNLIWWLEFNFGWVWNFKLYQQLKMLRNMPHFLFFNQIKNNITNCTNYMHQIKFAVFWNELKFVQNFPQNQHRRRSSTYQIRTTLLLTVEALAITWYSSLLQVQSLYSIPNKDTDAMWPLCWAVRTRM